MELYNVAMRPHKFSSVMFLGACIMHSRLSVLVASWNAKYNFTTLPLAPVFFFFCFLPLFPGLEMALEFWPPPLPLDLRLWCFGLFMVAEITTKANHRKKVFIVRSNLFKNLTGEINLVRSACNSNSSYEKEEF